MTDQIRDQQFDVLFTGKEYLCIPDPEDVGPRSSGGRIHQQRDAHRRRGDELVLDRQTVAACFAQRPCSMAEIRYVTGLPIARIRTAMQGLRREQAIEQIARALWRAV